MSLTYSRTTFAEPPTPAELEELTKGLGFTRIIAIVSEDFHYPDDAWNGPERHRFHVYTETKV